MWIVFLSPDEIGTKNLLHYPVGRETLPPTGRGQGDR